MILPRFYPVLPDAAMIARLVPMGVRLVQLRFKGGAGDIPAQIAAALAVCARHGRVSEVVEIRRRRNLRVNLNHPTGG